MAQKTKPKKFRLVIQDNSGVLEREINLRSSDSDKKQNEQTKREIINVFELLGSRPYQPASQDDIPYNWQERQELYELYSLVYHDGSEASNVNNLWWKIINKSVEPLASMKFRRKGKYFLLKDLLRPKVEFDDLMTKLNCACWHHFKPERAKDHIKADLEQIRNDANEIGVLRAKIRIRRKQIEKALGVPRKWLSERIEKENLRIERRLKEIYGLSVDENPQERSHRRHILTIAVMVLLSHYTTLTLEAIRQCIARLLFELGIADAEDEYELGNIEEALKREYSKDRQNFRAVFRLAKDLYEKTV